MTLTLYIDYISQPSRAVLAFCIFNKIPFQVKQVRVLRGETRSADYKKINPFGTVPAIDDDGYILYESHAILRYLAKSRKVQNPWYPEDAKEAAIVDAYLDWHHTNTRRAARFFLATNMKLFPQMPFNFNLEEETKATMYALKMIETVWLKDRKYIASNENITIADLSACCELMQLELIGFDFTPFPKVKDWMARLMSKKEMQQTHEEFYKVKKMFAERIANPKL